MSLHADERAASRFLRNATEFGLHLLLVLTPVFHGAVYDWAYLPARGLVFLLAGCTVFRLWVSRNSRVAWPWLTPAAVLFLGWVLLSVFSLPGPAVQALSPKSSARYKAVEAWRAEVETSVLEPLRKVAGVTTEAPRAPAVSPALSLAPGRTREALLDFLTPLMIFFVAASLGGSRRRTKRILLTVTVTAGLFSAYGLYRFLIDWHHPPVRTPQWSADRLTGTFINPNHFAFYLEIALPLAVAFLGSFLIAEDPEEPGGWKRLLTRLRQGWRGPAIIFSFLSAALSFLALLQTQSRMGMASFFLTCVLGAPFLVRKRRGRAFLVAGLLLLFSLAAAGFWVGVEQPLERLVGLAFGTGARDDRIRVWSDVDQMKRDFFLTGSGLGTFRVVFPKFRTYAFPLEFQHAHNDFLEIWAETGVVGFGLVLLGIALFGGEAFRWRGRREDPFILLFSGASLVGLGSATLHSAGDFGLRIPANAYLYASTAGLTLAALKRYHTEFKRGEAEEGRSQSAKARRSVLYGLALAALAWLLWDTAAAYRASLLFHSLEQGRIQDRADPKGRSAVLARVLSLRPKDDRYFQALASAEELQMRLDFAHERRRGYLSALAVLELVGRGQLLHPASGNLIFAEGLILSNLDRRTAQGAGRAFRASSGPPQKKDWAGEDAEREVREAVPRFAWRALQRAVAWEPSRLAFYYALALYGAFRWKSLEASARQETRDAFLNAAALSRCHPLYQGHLTVLQVVARMLEDPQLVERVGRIDCPARATVFP